MEKIIIGELDADCAKERVMLERVLCSVKAFYDDPKNVQAFAAWKNNKEDKPNGTSTNNS